jgi:hypothetical protein
MVRDRSKHLLPDRYRKDEKDAADNRREENLYGDQG